MINEIGEAPTKKQSKKNKKKEAGEMKERLEKKVGAENEAAGKSGKFQREATRMLRKHIHLLDGYGRGNDFAIYDESDTRALIRKILVDNMNVDKKKADPGLVKGT